MVSIFFFIRGGELPFAYFQTAMDVEVKRDYDPGDSPEESDTEDDDKEENESQEYFSEEEDEEYCPGGYHRIGSDDLLIDRCILQISW